MSQILIKSINCHCLCNTCELAVLTKNNLFNIYYISHSFPPSCRIDTGNSLKAMTIATVLLIFGGAAYLIYKSYDSSTTPAEVMCIIQVATYLGDA
jgi:hypothetical protein